MEQTANETRVPVLAKLIGLVLAVFSTLVAVGVAHPEKALAAEIPSTVTVSQGTLHPYPTAWVGTRDYYVNGNRAHCVEPQKRGVAGTYPTMSIEDSRNLYKTSWTARSIRAAVYHSYGAPGFNPAQWPTTNWRGTAMTEADYIIASHIILADVISSNGQQAMIGGTQQFKDWVGNNLLAYYQGNAQAHENATQWQIAYDDDVPNTFQAFVVNPNAATQALIAWQYTPTANLTIDKDTSTADGVYSLIVQDNDLYSLSGAEYGVYSDANATSQIGTVTTGADGVSNKIEVTIADLDEGSTVYYKELKAPAGYALDSTVYSTTLTAGEDATASVADVPRDTSGVTVDKDTINITEAEGDTSLAGATYRVEYFDVDTSNLNGQPKKIEAELAGKAPLASAEFQTGSDGQLHFADAKAVNGTTWAYVSNGQNFMPVGTMRVTEVKAPAGYELDETPHYASLSASGDGEHDVTVTDSETGDSNVKSVEPVQYTGTVSGNKLDAQAHVNDAQGAASLNATYSLYNVSVNGDNGQTGDGSVFYGGKKVASASTPSDANLMATVTADAETGAWSFGNLPYGTYIVKETAAPTGYLVDNDWQFKFTIDADHEQVTPDDAEQNTNQVFREDFNFTKKADGDKDRLANVPFLVTSDTTGESHVIVTDENGFFDSAASFNRHTASTNANDAAVTKGADGKYVVDESKLVTDAGVWFTGYANDNAAKVKADDSLRALPYDTYTVSELPSSANDGKDLVTFHLTMHRNDYALDYGTVYDDEVGIHTQATNPDTGTQTARAAEKCVISDAVSYEGLEAGKEYTISGTLHMRDADGNDAGTVKDADGNDVVATKTFTPNASSGTVEMTFEFDATQLEGKTVVAFEDCSREGMTIATHADISDEGQTVKVKPNTPPAPSKSKPAAKPSQKAAQASPAPTSMPQLGNNPALIIALVIVAAAAVAGGVTLYRRKNGGNKD